ncbi:MAG: hypothetical protein CVV02_00555 [Firmicutes bacterium HGW-Firmicutes-7]|nr:MAG: hypothetical protein CVV02_00555 [Firmicutes bacterium HGW-Firmicutes-7]
MKDERLSDSIKIVLFNKEEKYVNDFLALPMSLYSKENIMQNKEEERSLLLSQHPLSKYFVLYKMLVYEKDQVVARGILTLYPEDENGYFGFFEAKEGDYATMLFTLAEKICRDKEIKKIIGPVSSSFWITYRQKTNQFGYRPYTSEPYNMPYYKELWLKNGFEVGGRWVSNYYDIIQKDDQNEKCNARLSAFLKKGYEIVSPKKKNFEKCMSEIYDLIVELYCDFPVFKKIDRKDFMKLFSSFRTIIDFSMVKMAYYNGEAVGFFIGIPNYSNSLYGKITLQMLIEIFIKRRRSDVYIMLYMGVKKEHLSLGNAITQTIIERLKKKKAFCYGALIKEGKVTEHYVEDKIKEQYEYLLYEKMV